MSHRTEVEIAIPRGKVGRRRSVLAWVRVGALTAAQVRLEGQLGNVARLEMLHRLEDVYDESGFSSEHTSGVAALDPDGHVVAMYYGPNDARNTSVSFATYCVQHRLVPARFRLVPAGRGPANDVSSPNAYLPAAARGRDIP